MKRPYKGHSCHKIIGPGDCRQDNDCRYGYYRKQYKNSVESCWPRGKKVKLQVGRGTKGPTPKKDTKKVAMIKREIKLPTRIKRGIKLPTRIKREIELPNQQSIQEELRKYFSERKLREKGPQDERPQKLNRQGINELVNNYLGNEKKQKQFERNVLQENWVGGEKLVAIVQAMQSKNNKSLGRFLVPWNDYMTSPFYFTHNHNYREWAHPYSRELLGFPLDNEDGLL